MLTPIVSATEGLTLADAIVLAGYVANEAAGGAVLPFCGGRVDAQGSGGAPPPERDYYDSPRIANWDNMKVMGLTPAEFVAL